MLRSAFVLACLGATSIAGAVELSLPVACSPGLDCAIQQYVDHLAGPEAADYRCGGQTYDGHNGTDIRVPTLRDMEQGVGVVAAADGVVARTRDGIPDRIYTPGDPDVADRECGNGVLIDHADGWITQYCHLKQGSIVVRPGDPVKAGARLGEIGLSGQTEFPHLEFIVRRGAEVIDPFDPERAAHRGGLCNASVEMAPLWRSELVEALQYRDPFILNVGFSDGRITMQDVESGSLSAKSFNSGSPALVFFGRAIGIRRGDVQRLTLTSPDGSVLVDDTTAPAERAKAQLFAFSGGRRPGGGWQSGTYLGRYTILRDGAEVASREARLDIR